MKIKTETGDKINVKIPGKFVLLYMTDIYSTHYNNTLRLIV